MAKLGWIRASLAASLAALLGVSLGVALFGCNQLGGQAKQIESGFVGMEAHALRRCLGDAQFLEIRDDGSEMWAYTAPLAEEIAEVEISRSTGPGTAFQRPRVEAGNPVERPSYQTPNAVAEGRVPAGSCVYLFTLRDGAVGAYRARGRNYQDMNADAPCTLALKRCVPSVAAAKPASAD